ncbi:Holliday junction resolvase [Candidatus Woesearchaeota archaeon]|nr:Holliday junction resolvase [Candidatus Woesearchaeota archaeon]
MSSKQKGSNAERELVHLFWHNGWTACRVAGSGSMRYPSPDVIASNGQTVYVVECKCSKVKTKYVPLEDIDELVGFAQKFGAVPLIGVRFSNKEWMFLSPFDLETSGKFALIKRESSAHSFSEIVSHSSSRLVATPFSQ